MLIWNRIGEEQLLGAAGLIFKSNSQIVAQKRCAEN